MSVAKRLKLESDNNGIIVTHSGTFHADDALAVNLLQKLPSLSKAEIVRTRDPAKIAQGTIVVDVGAEYVPETNRYDHHQRGFNETFDADHKIKLSSAGLVWKHFGQDILAAHLNFGTGDERLALLHKKMYDDFIEAIDAIDNGIALYPDCKEEPNYKSRTDLSSRVGYMNPRWNQPFDEDDLLARFRRASAMAGTEFFDRVDDALYAWLPARDLVVDALNTRKSFQGADPHGRIVLFDGAVGWKGHIFDLEKAMKITDDERPLYVLYPDEAGKWRVQAVPVSNESFESRKALPEAWRGLRDEQLSEVSGIPECVFVHQSGFIGAHATKQGALEMATKALQL
ncbi:hypothetical protein MYAM1_003048 [Malassezia yamatoensis]|uniref:Metal-dependent protein hydrolase n=1 Tax=Malassezia yamatoensis TaxID=253288 RepID=A0AAJ5Z121_9BASI|nr:hypothetical protein MYAM1_003048 [Malassezia yamatoensis]